MRKIFLIIFLLATGCGGGYMTLPEHQRFVGPEYKCPDNIIKYGDPRFPRFYTCKWSK